MLTDKTLRLTSPDRKNGFSCVYLLVNTWNQIKIIRELYPLFRAIATGEWKLLAGGIAQHNKQKFFSSGNILLLLGILVPDDGILQNL
jgi:hypothetical protein